MLPYVLRRVLLFVPTLLGITFLSFALLQLAPGDAAELALGGGSSEAEVSQESVARFRHAYLLDQPIWKQYLHYLGPFDLSGEGHAWFGGSGAHSFGGLLSGDLKSEIHRPHVRVADELRRRLAVTVPLAFAALLLGYLVALPLGILAAVRAGTAVDRASVLFVFALYCVPTFWAGLLLQLLFGATGLGWLPVIGLAPEGASPVEVLRHALLPVVCLAYGSFAYLSRQMCAGLLETLSSDYVRSARAKGLPERSVIAKHALRNALLPVATLFASVFPALIGGAVIVETIFDLPGVGRYAYEGLQQRDYFVVMATTTLSGVMTCVGILVSDLLTAALDPRIRHG
ncbi:MAG: ABC transporter permease [Planctomycetes bacterium]|nr:ABC transporter permease [Planctomycetota bacterium]